MVCAMASRDPVAAGGAANGNCPAEDGDNLGSVNVNEPPCTGAGGSLLAMAGGSRPRIMAKGSVILPPATMGAGVVGVAPEGALTGGGAGRRAAFQAVVAATLCGLPGI
jgi:hypothetical protein